MAGPKPQKRWLSIPIRIAARITVILAIWKKKQHQTYGNPGPDLGRPYTFQREEPAYLCKIFLLQLNMPGVLNDSIQCLFTRFCSLGGLVGMNFGLHLQVTVELCHRFFTAVTALVPSCHHRCRPASNLAITNESNKDASPQKEQTERNRFKSTMSQSVSIWLRIPFISQPKPYKIHPDRHGWWKLWQMICFPYSTTPVYVELSHKFQKNCRLPFLKLARTPCLLLLLSIAEFLHCLALLLVFLIFLLFTIFITSQPQQSDEARELFRGLVFCLAHLLDIWILRIIGKVLGYIHI